MLYEKTIEDVIEGGLVRKVDKEDQTTTVMIISDEIRLGILQLRNRQPIQWTIEQIAIHGFSCIEHECSKQIDEIEKLQIELTYAKIMQIREITSGTKASVDSVKRKIKQGVKIRTNILNAMGRYADVLGLDRSALFRFCLYFSFTTSQSIVMDIKEKAKIEKENFTMRVKHMSGIFKVLKIYEEENGKRTENNV